MMDKGTTFFPYFKLVCFFGIIFLGIAAHICSHYYSKRHQGQLAPFVTTGENGKRVYSTSAGVNQIA